MNNEEAKEALNRRAQENGLDICVVEPSPGVFRLYDRTMRTWAATRNGTTVFSFDLLGVILAAEVIGAYAVVRS